MPTDAAEREQKPSLAWIMPSREEEKPTLRRISHFLAYAPKCGMTQLKQKSKDSSFIFALLPFHLMADVGDLGTHKCD